jgi:adenylate cyclase
MLLRIIKYGGIFVLVLFSAFSIMMAFLERELLPGDPLKELTSYTSFFEDRFYDMRMRVTLDQQEKNNDLVLASIDDYSLNRIGVWPLPRSVWTDFLQKMEVYGAKVIAFDVFFSEQAPVCNGLSPDQDFSEAITSFQSHPDRKVILPYSLSSHMDPGFEEMPDVMYDFIADTREDLGVGLFPTYQVGKRVFPIDALLEAGPGLAIIETSADPDGIFRHYKITSKVEDFYLPSYGLMSYEYFTGDRAQIQLMENEPPQIKFETGTLNLNIRGETKIRWFGDYNQYPIVPLFDIINAADDDPEMIEVFQDKLVFVGSTAYGAHDFRHTPIDPMMAGVFFHMNLVEMLLKGRFFKPLNDSTLYSWIILFTATAIMILVMLMGNALFDLITLVVLVTAMTLYDTYVLLPAGYEIKLFFCIFSVAASYSWETFLNFYITTKEKNKIRGTFSSFVAPAVVDQMLANPDMVKVGGEKKNITVFFSDVRDFTSISERLTPEGLATLLNQYMGVMTDLIFANKGTLDKYIGDAIVAFWGAPLDVEDHPYHAVKTAIAMVEALPPLNEKLKEQGYPELEHGMGMNTGDCSVGNMGSDKIFSYTALGDNMNLGARAEALCKFYGVQINITEFTLEAIRPELRTEIRYRILDKVRVKGKEQAISLYEVFHPSHPLYERVDLVEKYHQAFDCYQTQKFEQAVSILKELLSEMPDDPSFNRVLETCQDFIDAPPPPDWDGVYTHKTKG